MTKRELIDRLEALPLLDDTPVCRPECDGETSGPHGVTDVEHEFGDIDRLPFQRDCKEPVDYIIIE